MNFVSAIISAYKELGLHSFIQTIRFNVHYFGKKNGLKLPVFIYDRVYFKQRLGNVELQSFETGNVKIGKCIVGVYDKANTEIQFNDSCSVYLGKNVIIGSGCRVSASGRVKIFENVCITAETMFICNKSIEIGKNSLISWNVQIMDTDIHKIYNDNKQTNPDSPISIGERVWINSGCVILKGTRIADKCVVGANSLLNKEYSESNSLIVGNPAKCVRNQIEWER